MALPLSYLSSKERPRLLSLGDFDAVVNDHEDDDERHGDGEDIGEGRESVWLLLHLLLDGCDPKHALNSPMGAQKAFIGK